jgi:hypothetical protein
VGHERQHKRGTARPAAAVESTAYLTGTTPQFLVDDLEQAVPYSRGVSL